MVAHAAKCQKCGFRTRVISSKWRVDGLKSRVRFCPACWHRQTTVQYPGGPEGIELKIIDYGKDREE